MSALAFASVIEIMQAPVAGQDVHAVVVVGLRAVLIAPPSPAFHFKRWRTAPAPPLFSMKATLVPSAERIGEVAMVPVVLPPVALRFVL